MALSSAETAGCAVNAEELAELTIGDETFVLEAPFPELNPEVVAAHIDELVVARQLNSVGNFATTMSTSPYPRYPEQPRGPDVHAPIAEKLAHERRMAEHKAAVARHISTVSAKSLVLVPPVIGRIERPSDNVNCFSVRQLDNRSRMLPYTGTEKLASYIVQAVRLG
jgi:hypothetical protein